MTKLECLGEKNMSYFTFCGLSVSRSLSVCLSLSLCLSLCLSVCLSLPVSVYLSLCVFLSFSLFLTFFFPFHSLIKPLKPPITLYLEHTPPLSLLSAYRQKQLKCLHRLQTLKHSLPMIYPLLVQVWISKFSAQFTTNTTWK